MSIWIWLIIVGLAIVMELFTTELFGVWIALGGLVALILTAFSLEWYIPVSAFLIVSVVLILTARKITLKLINKTPSKSDGEDTKE